MKENIITAVGLTAAGILLAVTLVLGAGADYRGPQITFLYDITYSEGQDIAVLLDGVEAFDERDGDVTANVMVDSLIVLNAEAGQLQFAKVTYTAKDKSNNITKASRIVGYEGSGRSIYSASASEMMTEQEETGTVVPDAETTAAETTVAEETSGTEETTGEPETTAAEETSGTEETTGEPETTAPRVREAPVLTLSTREVTIHAGERFNIASFVSSITDNKDSRETLYRRIAIDGTYDAGTAGTYTFKVYCIDSDKNVSNKESFTLHVSGGNEAD